MGARQELERIESERQGAQSEINGIFQDQERIRENLKALGGSREEKAARARYLDRLSSGENALAGLRAQVEDLLRRIHKQEDDLARLISELS